MAPRLQVQKLGAPILPTAVAGLFLVAAAAATACIATDVARCLWARVAFPFDIDWVESGQLYHAQRLMRGEAIYGATTAEFLPHPYPPLHFAALALLGSVFHLDHALGRMLSVVAWFSAVLIAAGLIMRQSASRAWGLAGVVAAVGLCLRTYPYAGGWFDLVRADSLALALAVAAGACVAARDLSRARVVAAGVITVVGVYVKQTNVFYAIALLALVTVRSRARGRDMAVAIALPAGAALVALELATGGAFHGWILSTAGHSMTPPRLMVGTIEVITACPLVVSVIAFAWLARGAGPCACGPASAVIGVLWLASIPASLLGYAKAFGAANNLIPLLTLSALVPVALATDGMGRASTTSLGRLLRFVVAIAAFVTIAFGRFDSTRFAPSSAVTADTRAMLAEARALPGSLACPLHPFLATQVGKGGPQSSWLAELDAWNAHRPGATPEHYLRGLLARRPDWILLANVPVEEAIVRGIAADYVVDHTLHAPERAAFPLFDSIPRVAYRRRDAAR